jgi:hypothetical protein
MIGVIGVMWASDRQGYRPEAVIAMTESVP